MADPNGIDLFKIFTLIGTAAGAVRAIIGGYKKMRGPSPEADEERKPEKPPVTSPAVVLKPIPTWHPDPRDEEPEDEMSNAKLNDLDNQLKDLRVENRRMHGENVERLDNGDRRYQLLLQRYQEMDRKLEEICNRFGEMRENDLQEVNAKLRELKHDLRSDIRGSNELIRDLTHVINRSIAQGKGGGN